MCFDGDEIIEADMVMEATQSGEIFGIPATNRKIRFDVHERCRFVDGKLAERWAQVDLEDISASLLTEVALPNQPLHLTTAASRFSEVQRSTNRDQLTLITLPRSRSP